MKSDTSTDAEKVLIEGYRKMSPTRKLQRVFDLSDALKQLARARIISKWGDSISEREIRLRIAALSLDKETMIKVFNYDPDEAGY